MHAAASRADAASEALDHYHRGASLYASGDLSGAEAEFRSALALDAGPHRGARVGMHFEDYDPRFQIGRIDARLGRFEEARKMFDACAASGYTERSENAEEFRRWRAVVQEALAAATATIPTAGKPSPEPGGGAPASSTPTPVPAATAAARPSPPSPEPPPASTQAHPAPAARVEAPSGKFPPPPRTAEPAKGSAELLRVPPPATREAAVAAPPRAAAPTSSPTPATAGSSAAAHPSEKAPERPPLAAPVLAWLAAAAAALLLGGLAAVRLRRAGARSTELVFGRYAVGDLIAAGRHAFVYAASDRKTGEPVALKLRAAPNPSSDPDRFEREARSLERERRSTTPSPAPRLVARGAVRSAGAAVEFVALERLRGRTLADFARNARRNLDARLCLDILAAVIAAIERGREAGLGHEELAADDVFLLEPLPLNPGNPVSLRILGWTERRANEEAEVRGVAAIAAEIFRGRGHASGGPEVFERAPGPLRDLLRRAGAEAGAPAPSLRELREALEVCGTRSGVVSGAAP